MTRKIRATAAIALIGATALLATGCSAGGNASSGGSDGKVSMTFWNNSTTGPGKAFWQDTVKAFEAKNPNVTIKIQAIQNEDLDGKLQTALKSNSAPDVFSQRGGGKMAAMVNAGHVAPYLCRDGTTAAVTLPVDVPLGLFADTAYRSTDIALRPGDRLVMVTDGMLEREAATLDLVMQIDETRGLHPRETTRHLTDMVLGLSGSALADDATLLVLDWHGDHGQPRQTTAGAEQRRASPRAAAD